MFKHVANYEAQLVWHNATHDHKVEMDYSVAPHAVFTHPQIASVGLKEAEAKQHYATVIGTALFKDTAQGAAMGKIEGFVKVVLEKKTEKILGAHIIGPHASILIQEIVNADDRRQNLPAHHQRNAHSPSHVRGHPERVRRPQRHLMQSVSTKPFYIKRKTIHVLSNGV